MIFTLGRLLHRIITVFHLLVELGFSLGLEVVGAVGWALVGGRVVVVTLVGW